MKLCLPANLAIAIVAPLWCGPTACYAGGDDGTLLAPKAFRAAADRVLPSVVTIETYGSIAAAPTTRPAQPPPGRPAPGRRPRPQPGGIRHPGEGPTTGIIISPDGYIITSTYNFIRNQPIITVVLRDGTQHVARLLGRDETRKLCILKIDGVKDLPVAPTVPQRDLKVGQWAISVGFGYGGDDPAISAGIVSALNRIGGRAVQTDANLSPANYGGPLIDVEGRVLGICVPLSPQGRDAASGVEWYDSGIGFAVPLAGLETLVSRMSKGEAVKAGWLGIRPAPEPVADGGVSIADLVPNSPAAQAGMQKGDVIRVIGSHVIGDAAALANIMATFAAGDTITIECLRGTEKKTFAVKLIESPAQPTPPRPTTLPARPATRPASKS